MNLQPQPQQCLTVFKLVMMCVVAIDSLKNLPANAQYGTSLLFYYLIAIVLFFIPYALVSAELATCLPHTGGVYVWVREAFGKRMAFLMIWIQWIIAIIWYPTILSFIAVTLSYLINPNLAYNKIYILVTILILFWFATFFISKGIKISSKISSISAVIGVIMPMILISILGIVWIYKGNILQIHLVWNEITFNKDNLRLFITLLYSLMGMEMIAAHAGDVQNPQRKYPLALLISSFIILVTVIPASLAIAIVIPPEKIGLTTGVVESFGIFLNAFHLAWLKPVMVISIAIGSFEIFYTWLLNATRCLLISAQDGCLPKFLQKNSHDMSIEQLLLQGTIFTILSTIFVLMPSVNVAFWFLTAACAQLALFYYVCIFSSALYLRYKKPHLSRPFQVGKHPIVIWIVCITPIITCLISIVFGFFPPPDVSKNDLMTYELFLFLLIIVSLASAMLIFESDKIFFVKNKTAKLSNI